MSDPFARTVTVDGVRGHGDNLLLALLAGLIAAIIGAAVWTAITVATNMHLGIVAIGVGALVGFAIRIAGNGTTIIYGILGALFTAASCISGEVLAVILQGTSASNDFWAVASHVNYSDLLTTIVSQASVMTYVIYGIGIFEGYKFAIRK